MPATDLTVSVHKAWRRYMFDVLVRTGALDVSRREEVEHTLTLVAQLLGVLQAPAPALNAAMRELRHADPAVRSACADRVYRELTALVGHELLRLHEAEAASPRTAVDGVAATLDRRQRLALLDDDEVDDMLGWMADALAPRELSALLEDLHAAA